MEPVLNHALVSAWDGSKADSVARSCWINVMREVLGLFMDVHEAGQITECEGNYLLVEKQISSLTSCKTGIGHALFGPELACLQQCTCSRDVDRIMKCMSFSAAGIKVAKA